MTTVLLSFPASLNGAISPVSAEGNAATRWECKLTVTPASNRETLRLDFLRTPDESHVNDSRMRDRKIATKQREFSSIRLDDIFVHEGKSFKKMCERTAAPFVVLENGTREFGSAVPFFAEETVELDSVAGKCLDRSGMMIEEFEFLVEIALIPADQRQTRPLTSAQKSEYQLLNTCAHAVFEMLMGNRRRDTAAGAWLAVIERLTSLDASPERPTTALN